MDKEQLAARVAELEAKLAEQEPPSDERYPIGQKVFITLGEAEVVDYYSEDLTAHIDGEAAIVVEKIRVKLRGFSRDTFEPVGPPLLCSFALADFEKQRKAYPRMKAKRLNEIAKGGSN